MYGFANYLQTDTHLYVHQEPCSWHMNNVSVLCVIHLYVSGSSVGNVKLVDMQLTKNIFTNKQLLECVTHSMFRF